jgi:hypothetical protein
MSDTAAPNRLMVTIADQLAGRGGDMVRALDLIGHGAPAAEGKPFLLSALFTRCEADKEVSGSPGFHGITLD